MGRLKCVLGFHVWTEWLAINAENNVIYCARCGRRH